MQSIYSTYLTQMPFISSCLISVARTSRAMLNKRWKQTPLSYSWSSGNTFSFCPLGMMLAMSLSYMAFIMLRKFPLFPLCWEFLSQMVLDFTNCFFCIYRYDNVIFIFHFVYVVYHIYWFVDIVLTLHSLLDHGVWSF